MGCDSTNGDYTKSPTGTRHASALLVVVTQLLKATSDSFTHTEATEKPIIRVPTAVVDGPAEATIIVAGLACRS